MRTIQAEGYFGKRVLLVFIIFLAFGPACANEQVTWGTDLNEALKQASVENKFIVLDISASW